MKKILWIGAMSAIAPLTFVAAISCGVKSTDKDVTSDSAKDKSENNLSSTFKGFSDHITGLAKSKKVSKDNSTDTTEKSKNTEGSTVANIDKAKDDELKSAETNTTSSEK